MEKLHYTSPDQWVALIFSAQSAKGGVVRRSVQWVETKIGCTLFEAEVRRRGFHLLIAGRQYVVVCNSDPIRILF